jgi:hypothetical protein
MRFFLFIISVFFLLFSCNNMKRKASSTPRLDGLKKVSKGFSTMALDSLLYYSRALKNEALNVPDSFWYAIAAKQLFIYHYEMGSPYDSLLYHSTNYYTAVLSNGLDSLKGGALYFKGLAEQERENHASAITYLQEAYRTDLLAGQTRYYANYINGLGISYDALGDDRKALDYYYQSLSLAEEQNDTIALIRAYQNIGLLKIEMELYEQARNQIAIALALSKESGNLLDKGKCSNKMGVAYDYQEMNDSAFHYYGAALNIFEHLEAKYWISRATNNIGLLYDKMGVLDSARLFYEQSYKLKRESYDTAGFTTYFLNVGTLLSATGEPDSALSFLHTGLKNVLRFQDPLDEKQLLKGLYAHHKKYGALDSALYYHEQYHKKDSLFSNEKLQKDAELLGLYHSREENLKKLTKTQEERIKSIKQRNTLLMFALALLISFFTVLFFLRKIKQQNEKLKEKNYKVSEEVDVLTTQKAFLVSEKQKAEEKLNEVDYYSILPDKHYNLGGAKKKQLRYGDIIYIQRDKETGYACFYTTNDLTGRKYRIDKSLKDVYQELKEASFFVRIHRSTIVNMMYMVDRNSQEITLKLGTKEDLSVGVRIKAFTIGRAYKKEVGDWNKN